MQLKFPNTKIVRSVISVKEYKDCNYATVAFILFKRIRIILDFGFSDSNYLYGAPGVAIDLIDPEHPPYVGL